MIEWKIFERSYMHSHPFIVDTIVDTIGVSKTLIDSGCFTYGVVNERFCKETPGTNIPHPRHEGQWDGR
jgi:hypothetical protein